VFFLLFFQEILPFNYRWDSDNSGHKLVIGIEYFTRIRARNIIGAYSIHVYMYITYICMCVTIFFIYRESTLCASVTEIS